jgi:hypothetical protein
MRVFLILVAVLAVIFFAAMGLGGGKDDCRPPFVAASAQDAGKKECPAPKIKLSKTSFQVDDTHSAEVSVPPSQKKSPRIVKFALVSGDAVLITYQHSPSCSAKDCKAVALCVYKSEPLPAGCTKDNSHAKDGSIVVADDGGSLTFKVLGPGKRSATVNLQ